MQVEIFGTPQNLDSLQGGDLCYVIDDDHRCLALITEDPGRGERLAILLEPTRDYLASPGARYLRALVSKIAFRLDRNRFSLALNLNSVAIPNAFGEVPPGSVIQVGELLYLAFKSNRAVNFLRVDDGQIYSSPPDGEGAHFSAWTIEYLDRESETVILAHFPYPDSA